MNDMRQVIVAKSDQLNADDLIGVNRTITIREVAIRAGTEQPVSIFFDGDDGKPWRPCKSMSRVLVNAWGPDANAYVGRSLTLYRDPKVTWGGMEVGGIRISHMSHIERELAMALNASNKKKAVTTIKPLVADVVQHPKQDAMTIDVARDMLNNAASLDALRKVWQRRDMAPFRGELQADLTDRKAALEFDSEGPADTDRGEEHADTDRIIADIRAATTADEIGSIMERERAVLRDMATADSEAVSKVRHDALEALRGTSK